MFLSIFIQPFLLTFDCTWLLAFYFTYYVIVTREDLKFWKLLISGKCPNTGEPQIIIQDFSHAESNSCRLECKFLNELYIAHRSCLKPCCSFGSSCLLALCGTRNFVGHPFLSLKVDRRPETRGRRPCRQY